MKKIIIALFFVLVAVFFLSIYYFSQKKPVTAEVNGHKFQLEVADNQEKRVRGLGGRGELCQECGLVFIFPQKGIYSFIMRGMQFDLDIIWINEGKVVYLAKNMSRENQSSINPGKKADKVLEINAGLADKYGIKEGDLINFAY